MTEITEESWKSMFHDGKPMLIEIYSEMCVPCKMVANILEQIIEEPDTSYEFTVGRLNGSIIGDIPLLSGVSSIPTLILTEQQTVHILPREFQKSQILKKVKEILKGRYVE